jgi:hypothetical protein
MCAGGMCQVASEPTVPARSGSSTVLQVCTVWTCRTPWESYETVVASTVLVSLGRPGKGSRATRKAMLSLFAREVSLRGHSWPAQSL